jgi:hypothetical protein
MYVRECDKSFWEVEESLILEGNGGITERLYIEKISKNIFTNQTYFIKFVFFEHCRFKGFA